MDIETRITEILISLLLISIIAMPFIIVGLITSNVKKDRLIKKYEITINELRFEKEYIDYVWQDSIRQ